MASEDFDDVRLATPLGTPFKRVNGYPTYEEDMITCHGEDEWIVRASDLADLLAEIIPQNSVLDGIPVHADSLQMSGYDWLRAAKVQVTPLDNSRPFNPLEADGDAIIMPALENTYGPLARLHIWFEPMSSTLFSETRLSAGAEYLHIAPNMLQVSQASNGDPITSQSAPGQTFPVEANKEPSLGAYKQIPTIVWDYTVRAFINPPWENLFAAIGKVNSKAQEEICNSALPETVMFAGLSGTRTYRWYNRDEDAWVLDVKLAQRFILDGGNRYGWNHVYSPLKGKWTKLTRRGSGLYLYDQTDIGALFGLI